MFANRPDEWRPIEINRPGSGWCEHATSSASGVPQPMAENAGGPVILIEPHIVKGRSILRPNCCAAGVGHHIGEVGASFDDANTRRIKLGASFVG